MIKICCWPQNAGSNIYHTLTRKHDTIKEKAENLFAKQILPLFHYTKHPHIGGSDVCKLTIAISAKRMFTLVKDNLIVTTK